MTSQTPDIIFVNRFFWPDHSATAQILSDVAQHLAQSGFHVRIITSRMLYSDPSQVLTQTENWKGVEVSRVWTARFGRSNLMGRAIDYLTFYVAAFFAILHHARKNSIVISKTDPPLIGVPIGLAARLKRAKRGNWFQDVYPEIAEAYGLKLVWPLVNILRWCRNRSIRKAAINVAIGDRMAAFLQTDAKPSRPIDVIHNFSDDDAVQPNAKGVEELRAAWGFDPEDFVVGYSGNLGRAHDTDTILEAAELLRDQPRIKFLFVGGGQQRVFVEEAAANRALRNIVFRAYQPRDQLAASLGVPDLHWISLKQEFEGLILPSKLYGIAAVGRPVLMIGSRDGEISRLIFEFSFGASVEAGEAQELANEIVRFSGMPKRGKDMGVRARQFLDTSSSKGAAMERWRNVLMEPRS
ncbi:glycosyltransferase family 4 protein [Henriciella algicola]|uniref:Glycosyltransferase WbuB n=1 Tax=Henriciella algicola TaxID=1608422 RepID=A0A399RCC7_9PROT|nr:glycosyltransferase family 4 protein [Henriciella algicola]RIJ29206.1 glycosyltransferase WbuB [Henriciella algicola]